MAQLAFPVPVSTPPFIDVRSWSNEERFNDRIQFLKGTHGLHEIHSSGRTSVYFKLEVNCSGKNGFTLSATIIGDIFRTVKEARDNVFQKGIIMLQKRFRKEMAEYSQHFQLEAGTGRKKATL